MHVLDRRGLPLPEIVVIDKYDEIPAVRKAGLPYVVRPGRMSDENILKALLFGILIKMFPWVKWGSPSTSMKQVVLVAPEIVDEDYNDGQRIREGGGGEDFAHSAERFEAEKVIVNNNHEYRESTGEGFMDDDGETLHYSEVNMEALYDDGALTINAQELMDAGLLPKWLLDIGESIRANLSSYVYNDCYNRKLGAYLGEYALTDERPNLIVLDVSGSIPRGISFTMVGLIQTLCSQNNADLIINSGVSQWWPHNEPLDIDKIARVIGGCNEARQFYSILEEHVLGKKWGNVIGFGDYDSPCRHSYKTTGIVPSDAAFAGTEIGCAIGYHTSCKEMPGYLRWVKQCNTQEVKFMGTSWTGQVRKIPYDTSTKR